jgi:hypothetical protein
MRFVPQDNRNMWFQAGVRVQGTLENVDTDFSDPSVADKSESDAYLRRARLEVGAGFGKNTSFYMDIRSDRVNQGFRDEGEFKIGDAYVKISKPFDTSLVNFKLYRAKIDVSRTETVKSALLLDGPSQASQLDEREVVAMVPGAHGSQRPPRTENLPTGQGVQSNICSPPSSVPAAHWA